jgi:hypothetical protein
MARGNQRDKAREKTQKEQAGQVSAVPLSAWLLLLVFPLLKGPCRYQANDYPLLQKKKNTV